VGHAGREQLVHVRQDEPRGHRERPPFSGNIDINATQGVRYAYDQAGKQDLLDATGDRSTPLTETVTSRAPAGHDVLRLRSRESAHPLGSRHDVVRKCAIGVRRRWLNTSGIRHYDAAGRLSAEITFHLNHHANYNAAGGDDFAAKVYHRYDARGDLARQVAIDYKLGRGYEVTYTRDDAGNVKSSALDFRHGATNAFVDTSSYKYTWDGAYHEKEITKEHDPESGNTTTGKTTFTYDSNGHLPRSRTKRISPATSAS
jgi:hypothetical protein